MAQFQVPQFIEVEDKIFGPLTFKQFLYVLGGCALIFILWVLLPKWLAIILAIPVGGFFGSLAFLKKNGQPFMTVLSNAINYFASPRLYTWKKEEKIAKTASSVQRRTNGAQQFPMPKLTESKLKELSWSLDIHKKIR